MTRLIPKRMLIKAMYKHVFNKTPDLRNPKTFNEKIQWLKLNDRRDDYSEWADKCEAKKIVSSLCGEQYIVQTYGIWDNADDIDIDSLPEKFVLKCNHDCGSVLVCRDKKAINWSDVKKQFNKALTKNYYYQSGEWCYKRIKPLIFAEEYLEQEDGGIDDFKFFCFSGETKFLYISHGLEDHSTAQIGFYDLEGRELDFARSDYKTYHNAKIPENFQEMVNISNHIAQAIDNAFVRVDLYSINGRILFSEATFYPCGGMMPFSPAKADEKVGQMLDHEYKR